MKHNINQEEFYSSVDAAAITAVVGAVAPAVGAIASRPRSDIKQRCGRKPLFGKAKKKAYQDCVNKPNITAPPIAAPPVVAPFTTLLTAPVKEPMSKNLKMALIGGGILVLVVGIVLIIKSNKIKKPK